MSVSFLRRRPTVGVDLGTSAFRLCRHDSNRIVLLPAVIAMNTRNSDIVATGEDAARMLGRTPAGLAAACPMQNSAVADFDLAVLLTRELFRRGEIGRGWQRPLVLLGVPDGLTEMEKQTLADVITDAGARVAGIVPQPFAAAAAAGAGRRTDDYRGQLLVDVGGGTSKTALLSHGSIAASQMGRVAGDEFDRAIVQYLRGRYGLVIGEQTARRLKTEIGVAYAGIDRGSRTVGGRSVESGLAAEMTVTSADLCEALRKPLLTLLQQIRTTLEAVPPELSADVSGRGLLLCGDSARIPGFAKSIANGVGVRVNTPQDPGTYVIRGLQNLIQEE